MMQVVIIMHSAAAASYMFAAGPLCSKGLEILKLAVDAPAVE